MSRTDPAYPIEDVHEDDMSESHQLTDESLKSSASRRRTLLLRLGASFFLFGLINNVLYVIILSAALDLVPPNTPKGIIAFCNIFPALVSKIGWPYILKGRIRYARRLIGCCIISILGMIVVAASEGLPGRLLGISLASFSSGLGELTFLQLSTTYSPRPVSGHALGYFASGTGAAGLVGAALWWFLRALGVELGVGLSSIFPLIIPLAYFFLLPSTSQFLDIEISSLTEDSGANEYSAVPVLDPNEASEAPLLVAPGVSLTLAEKLALVKPLLLQYMLPLFCVYTFEYTINQGISPTLVYPVPSDFVFRHIIKSIRDYYPLWQLVYQTTVFLSRSSLSLGLPPISRRSLPLPAVVQLIILTILATESASGLFGNSETFSIALVFLLIGLEGICGGLAYVNVFYQIGQESSPSAGEKGRQEREFKIGSIGFADSLGILLASILAVPTEIFLCQTQVNRGKTLCKSL
ncbi:batten disease protein Cln3 [Sistotremastrum niveocremeum HHB9708]|uniref:Protein BTN n=1 Tax=Sistotremastrum niveocremeum HHB9708 TaxID=1314777 RepID=A0A164YJH3_9AGAM|nr:batten disease protein Cln3 [Sistotremastrum niveocremeum HHB9708]